MLHRVFFLVCLFVWVPPAMAQNAILAEVIPHLAKLGRAETLRGIKYAENAVADDLEETARLGEQLKASSEKEKREDERAFFKYAAYCYRALTLLLEKKDFPNIAAGYRARAQLFDDFALERINSVQFESRQKENEAAKLRALTSELAGLEKDGPPNEGKIRSLERMGQVLGKLILTAASKDLGDVPHIHAFNQGMMALQRDDHTNAAKFLRRLAERGDPRAQFWIGHFYFEGKGDLPQNFSEALKWLQRAADQQEAYAQYFLGSMYFKGEGVPRDLVTSYMWFSLAAAQGDDTATKARDRLAAHMTPAQIAEAKKRASEWKPAAR
jgi:TPR repeat protein